MKTTSNMVYTPFQKMKAKDCKCIICGKQAVAFWPVIDPDIPENPYCRKCLDETKARVIFDIFKADKEDKT